MAKFGGNTFTHFSVPLVYEGRYFLLEPGEPPLLTVFVLAGSTLEFEVLKNKPVGSTACTAETNATGVVTVSARDGGKFVYKVRPGSETSIAFGKLDGGELPVKITDKNIQVGGMTIENNTFAGVMAGVVVSPNGGVAIGARLPPEVIAVLAGR